MPEPVTIELPNRSENTARVIMNRIEEETNYSGIAVGDRQILRKIRLVLQAAESLYGVPTAPTTSGEVEIRCYSKADLGRRLTRKNRESVWVDPFAYGNMKGQSKIAARRKGIEEFCKQMYKEGYLVTAENLAAVFRCTISTIEGDFRWFARDPSKRLSFLGSHRGLSSVRCETQSD